MFGLGNLLIIDNDLSEAKKLIDKISIIDSVSSDYHFLTDRYNESVRNRMN